MSSFVRYIGIDYSGAETPTASLRGLRIYGAEGDAPPVEVPPPPSPRKYWTRKGIAEWLVERLAEDRPTLVGIDHGFSFPLRYFEVLGSLSGGRTGNSFLFLWSKVERNRDNPDGRNHVCMPPPTATSY